MVASHEFSKHVVEDTTVLHVLNLWLRIQSANNSNRFAGIGGNGDVLTDFECTSLKVDTEGLSSIKAVSISTLSGLELKWQNAHTDEVRSVNTLVALCNDSLDTLKERSLGGPIS